MKIYEIIRDDYDVEASGYVTDENEAIQLCLDGEYIYRELPKLEVSSEIMNKERFTLVEVVFRIKDDEWNGDDVRIYYSDKPFEKITNTHNLKFGWIALQAVAYKNETIEDTKQSICEVFEFMIEKVDSLDNYSDKLYILNGYDVLEIGSRW